VLVPILEVKIEFYDIFRAVLLSRPLMFLGEIDLMLSMVIPEW
jgi:hypothetical protein